MPSLRFRFLLLLLLLLLPGLASAQDRWALVIGVSTYESDTIPSLRNTVNDARTVAAALDTMGFEVYYLENAAKAEVEATVRDIAAAEGAAELGLVYFAGHGLQVEGQNYLLPSDVRAEGEDFLQTGAISVGALVADLNAIGTQSLVVILDSCRDSPFPDQEAVGTGLALVDAPPNTIIAYSTAPGAVAFDGAGANSPYTAALASSLEGGEQDMRDVLRLVRARVRLATGGLQTPWFIDNTRAPIVIALRNPAGAEELAATLGNRPITLSTTAWRTIVESADPRDFERFTALFPEDDLAQVARRQLAEIDRAAPDFPLMELRVEGPDRDIPGGLLTEITACDILATGTGDVRALVEPVPHDLVNTRAALRACVEAVRLDPDNARLVNHLARVLRLAERYDEALFYYERAAALGHPNAHGGIASFYRQGIGVERDDARAFEAAKRGAMLGAPQLRLLTGIFYREGWGVPQSFPEARRWTELAVQDGHVHAFVALGDFYRRGIGTTPDPARAVGYYRQAAALGSTDAMNLVGLAYMRGEGVERDTDTGIAWLVQASEQGNPHAAFSLGRAFNDGWGVKRDLSSALAYFRLSAQRNYLGAHIRIGDILRTGTDATPPDLPEAYANYLIAREAAIARDTRDSVEEKELAEARIAELVPTLSFEERVAGERSAADWIAQYGLLDFHLVNE